MSDRAARRLRRLERAQQNLVQLHTRTALALDEAAHDAGLARLEAIAQLGRLEACSPFLADQTNRFVWAATVQKSEAEARARVVRDEAARAEMTRRAIGRLAAERAEAESRADEAAALESMVEIELTRARTSAGQD